MFAIPGVTVRSALAAMPPLLASILVNRERTCRTQAFRLGTVRVSDIPAQAQHMNDHELNNTTGKI